MTVTSTPTSSPRTAVRRANTRPVEGEVEADRGEQRPNRRRRGQPAGEPEQRRHQAQGRGLAQHRAQHMAAGGAERAQDRELLNPLGDGVENVLKIGNAPTNTAKAVPERRSASRTSPETPEALHGLPGHDRDQITDVAAVAAAGGPVEGDLVGAGRTPAVHERPAAEQRPRVGDGERRRAGAADHLAVAADDRRDI
jgi:hypothetical protein